MARKLEISSKIRTRVAIQVKLAALNLLEGESGLGLLLDTAVEEVLKTTPMKPVSENTVSGS